MAFTLDSAQNSQEPFERGWFVVAEIYAHQPYSSGLSFTKHAM